MTLSRSITHRIIADLERNSLVCPTDPGKKSRKVLRVLATKNIEIITYNVKCFFIYLFIYRAIREHLHKRIVKIIRSEKLMKRS